MALLGAFTADGCTCSPEGLTRFRLDPISDYFPTKCRIITPLPQCLFHLKFHAIVQ